MDLSILLCFIFASPILGQGPMTSPTALIELDRARSAWNFGGGGQFRNRQWVRPKNIPGPGAIIANRRNGGNSWIMPSSPSNRRPSLPIPSTPIRSRQSKPYQKPNRPKPNIKPMKLSKLSRNSTYSSSQKKNSPFSSSRPSTMNKKPGLPKTMSSMRNRGSRMIESRSDNILNRFRKEDLWHLDKGEGYELKNEDLLMDTIMRHPSYIELENELDSKGHHHTMELDAENMVNEAEIQGHAFHDGDLPSHVHHHHHYDGQEEEKGVKKAKEPEKEKKEDPNKVIPATLPRVHLPIPLGCLLAVPAFHPIRPRHHLKCLLSIPGTPNMMRRRRRRRSADLPPSTPAQGPFQFFQMYDMNSRMSPTDALRKHFGPSHSRPSNLKVPATIIAPPKFDKSDVLDMLLGSAGINPKEMGTVLATNSRYVRFGRGLPSSSGRGVRGGRALQWFPDSSLNNFRAAPQYQSPAPAQPVHNNPVPAPQPVSNPLPVPATQSLPKVEPSRPTPTITIHSLSPTPTASTVQVKPTASNAPLVLNVQITAPSSSRAPQQHQVITISAPQAPPQQQSQPQAQPQAQVFSQPQIQSYSSKPSYPYQTLAVTPSGKTKPHGKFKYSDYWKPVTKNKMKPQKAYAYDLDYAQSSQYGDSIDTTDSKPQNSHAYDSDYTSSSEYNDLMDTSDSKQYYKTVKAPATTAPSSPSKKKNKKSKYYAYFFDSDEKEGINTYRLNPEIISTSQQQYYQNNNTPAAPTPSNTNEYQDLAALLNQYNGASDDHASFFNSENMANTIQTDSNYYEVLNNNPLPDTGYSFAVKTQPNEESTATYVINDNQNNSQNSATFYFDPSTVGTYSNGDNEIFSDDPSSYRALSSSPTFPYSRYQTEEENDIIGGDEGRYYYTVKKIQVPEPIYISVPKDYTSNEIK